jgi:hypothetical protein
MRRCLPVQHETQEYEMMPKDKTIKALDKRPVWFVAIRSAHAKLKDVAEKGEPFGQQHRDGSDYVAKGIIKQEAKGTIKTSATTVKTASAMACKPSRRPSSRLRRQRLPQRQLKSPPRQQRWLAEQPQAASKVAARDIMACPCAWS